MSEFTVEIDTTESIYISPEEYVESCDESEIIELRNLVNNNSIISSSNALDLEWEDICMKLLQNRLTLTIDEEKIIRSIAKNLFIS